MKKVAVIIKHAFRDYNYRVDIYEVTEDTSREDLYKHVKSKMTGPFEILAMTETLSLTNKVEQSK